MDDAVATFEEFDVASHSRIVVTIVGKILMQRAPRAKVAPSEVSGIHEYLLCFLKDGIVHGYALAQREVLVDGGLLSGRAVQGKQLLEHLRNLWLIDAEGIHDGGDAPHEDACVPEETAVLDVLLGHLQRGLFLESVHAVHVLLARGCEGEVAFYVALACLRACGLHAKRNDGVRFRGEVDGIADRTLEALNIHDDVVAGSYDNRSA